MSLLNGKYSDFLATIDNRKFICYGAGKLLDIMADEFLAYQIGSKIIGICDSNEKLWHKPRKIWDSTFSIMSPDELMKRVNRNIVILITSGAVVDIWEYLKGRLPNEIILYSFQFMRIYENDEKLLAGYDVNENLFGKNPKIPKRIHYCWFSGEKLPDFMQKCKESWKRFCPEYEIIEWNAANYDVNKIPYMAEAYKAKKWGFVGDYARLDVVEQYGGVYLDLDVELIRNIDPLLTHEGYTSWQTLTEVNFGSGFGAAAHLPILKKLKESYENVSFINENGELNLVASPVYQTKVLEKMGLVKDGTFQIIEGMAIYPFQYLCAKSLYSGQIYKTDKTYSVHHFSASWVDEKKMKGIYRNRELYDKLFISKSD